MISSLPELKHFKIIIGYKTPKNILVKIFIKFEQVYKSYQKWASYQHFKIITRYKTPEKPTVAVSHEDWTGKSKVTKRGLTINMLTS